MQTKIVSAGCIAALLAGCTLAPGPYIDTARLDQSEPIQPAADKYPVKPIDVAYFAEERAAAEPSKCPLQCLTRDTRNRYEYHVGVNDQLTIILWDHPEITGAGGNMNALPPIPQASAGNASANTIPTVQGGNLGGEGGLVVRVARDGTIFFPRVGRVNVLHKSTQQIQQLLTEGLRKTIRDPQLDVRVSGFNSQTVQVTGSVKNAAAESVTDLPLSVIDAINRAGGALTDADLQNVGVTRDGKRYTVDVAALLETGDPQQNVLLQDGDIVDIPDRSNSRVFVLGEVVHPTSLPMNRGKLTLADALTGANGLDVRTGDPRYIYVIRGAEKIVNPVSAQPKYTTASAKADTGNFMPLVYRLDMTQVDALMLMTKFELQPRDVVYVQVAASARFNRLLDQITPTLQTLFFTKALVN